MLLLLITINSPSVYLHWQLLVYIFNTKFLVSLLFLLVCLECLLYSTTFMWVTQIGHWPTSFRKCRHGHSERFDLPNKTLFFNLQRLNLRSLFSKLVPQWSILFKDILFISIISPECMQLVLQFKYFLLVSAQWLIYMIFCVSYFLLQSLPLHNKHLILFSKYLKLDFHFWFKSQALCFCDKPSLLYFLLLFSPMLVNLLSKSFDLLFEIPLFKTFIFSEGKKLFL